MNRRTAAVRGGDPALSRRQASSRFWRWALRCYCALYVMLLAAYAVAIACALTVRPLRIDAAGGLSAVDNPADWFGAVFHVVLVLLLALSAGFIVRQVLTCGARPGTGASS